MLKAVLARIEERLKATGKTAAEASREAGLSSAAIRNIQRAVGVDDRKGVSTATLQALAPVLGVDSAWLLDGVGQPRETVPLVGYVGAGAEAHFYADSQLMEEVPAPAGATANTRAAEIRGESLGPLFEKWLIFFDDVRSPITPDLLGKLCIVGLPDGKVLVKWVRKAGDTGRYHLESNTEGTLFDQEVMWAARVRQMTPR